MPTYSYQCQQCDHGFEARHSMHEQAPACPSCGGGVRKVLTATAVLGGGSASSPGPTVSSAGAGHACGCGKPHGCN